MGSCAASSVRCAAHSEQFSRQHVGDQVVDEVGDRWVFQCQRHRQVVIEIHLQPVDATVVGYLPFIRRFLMDRFGPGPIDFSALCAADVIGFISRQAARLIAKRAKTATSALRSFLGYLRYRGEIQCDLAAVVPTVPIWSMTGIPRAIAASDANAALAHCRRDTPVGCRDYAILLLLARLGLRAGEIVSLTLDSINWAAGSPTVTGKRGQPELLPLPSDVGEAIANYLQRGRPKSGHRALFLRA
jgi:integrase/recombinase XerD